MLADREKVQTFETKCLRKLRILHGAQDQRLGNFLVGPQEPLLPQSVKRWKLAWFRHVTRHNSLSKIILQGTLECG